MRPKWSLLALLSIIGVFLVFPKAFAEPKRGCFTDEDLSFSLRLYKELKKSGAKNIFFSPYSIRIALALAYEGARGRVQKEMAEVLHFPLDLGRLHHEYKKERERLQGIQKKGDIELHVANSLWLQKGYPVKKAYIHALKRYYSVTLYRVDFSHQTETARKEINLWVRRETKGKILELIKPGQLRPDTLLLLCNALYFKGAWLKAFDPKDTFKAPFYVHKQRTVQINFMSQQDKFRFLEEDDLLVLELPYKGKAFSMIIFLPREKDGLEEVETRLSPERIKGLLELLAQRNESEVILIMPKFKMSCAFELSQVLAKMGMPHAFKEPDFAGIDGEGQLKLGNVIHKAYVEVNEEGTKAAASTAVTILPLAVRPEEIRIDHPFLFLIRENQEGQILFWGRVVEPEGEAL